MNQDTVIVKQVEQTLGSDCSFRLAAAGVLACLVKKSVGVDVVVSALCVKFGHTTESTKVVGVAPVPSQQSGTSPSFMRPFLRSSGGKVAEMTVNTSSKGLRSSQVLGSGNNASNVCFIIMT